MAQELGQAGAICGSANAPADANWSEEVTASVSSEEEEWARICLLRSSKPRAAAFAEAACHPATSPLSRLAALLVIESPIHEVEIPTAIQELAEEIAYPSYSDGILPSD